MFGLSVGTTAKAIETNTLVNELVSIFGVSNISGLYIGDDIVTDSSKNVISWPGRFGQTLYNTSSYRFTITTSASNHPGLYIDTLINGRGLVDPNITYKHVFCMTSVSTLPFPAYKILVRATDATPFVLESEGSTSNIRTPMSSWQCYIDGYPTLNVPSTGTHIFECGGATANTGALCGGLPIGDNNWSLDPINLFLFLKEQPTPVQQRSARTSIWKYYGYNETHILSKEIAALYGPNLCGLWVGEDVVTSASYVSSWPARSGSTLLPSVATNSIQKTLLTSNNYHYGISNNQLVTDSSLSGSLLKLAGCFVVASTNTSSYTDYRTLLAAGDVVGGREFLTAQPSTTAFYNDGTRVHYVNGVITSTISSGSMLICESALTGASLVNNINVCGSPTYGATRNWIGTIGSVIALSATASIIQRGDTLGLLGKYYGFNSPNILEMQLKSIFGAKMIGLWLGDDIVIDGSNQISSWPGRIGPTLVNANAARFTINSDQGGHRQFYNTNSSTTALLTGSTTLSAFYTVLSVLDPLTLPFSTYRAVVGGDAFWLLGDTGTSNWYSAYSNSYKDGITGITVQTGSHIYERHYNFVTGINITVGNHNNNRGWMGGISCIMCLSGTNVNDTITTTQRTAYLNALRTYYNIV